MTAIKLPADTGHPVKDAAAREALFAEQIVSRYINGESARTLGADYRLNGRRVTALLKKSGVSIRTGYSARWRAVVRRLPAAKRAQMSAHARSFRRDVHATAPFEKAAKTRELNWNFGSYHERRLYELLRERGTTPVPQKAVGRYNVDLAITPVAVEVLGASWTGRHKTAAYRGRVKKILDQGWCLVLVCLTRSIKIEPGVADYIVALVKSLRSDPTPGGKYRVVWGDGEALTVDSLESYGLAFIPASRNS